MACKLCSFVLLRNCEGLVDDDGGWHPVNTIPEPEITQNRYEYASTVDLNENLKGLALAN